MQPSVLVRPLPLASMPPLFFDVSFSAEQSRFLSECSFFRMKIYEKFKYMKIDENRIHQIDNVMK